jgi:hypothetical protein
MFPNAVAVDWLTFDDMMDEATKDEIKQLGDLAEELRQEGSLGSALLVQQAHDKIKDLYEAKGKEAADEIIIELTVLRQELMKHERFIDKPKKV